MPDVGQSGDRFPDEDRALMERAKAENWPTGRLLTELRDQRRARRDAIDAKQMDAAVKAFDRGKR